MNIIDQARAALEKHQAEQYGYEYTELEKTIWINGYVRGAIDIKEAELKELKG